jgi:hypothetical protein
MFNVIEKKASKPAPIDLSCHWNYEQRNDDATIPDNGSKEIHCIADRKQNRK